MIGITILCISSAVLFVFLITKLSSISTTGFGRGHLVPPSMVVPLTVEGYTLLGRVTVGTPHTGRQEEQFTLFIDITSSTSWLFSVDICPDRNCNKEKFKAIDGRKSVTLQRKNRNDLGFLSEDRFKFGRGKEAPSAVLEFLEVTDQSFDYSGYDGRLGLSLIEDPASLAPTITGLFRHLKEPVFGMYLHQVPQKDQHGLMIVGGNDGALMEGPLNSHNILLIDSKFAGWNVKIDNIFVLNTDGTREQQPLTRRIATPAPASDDICLPMREYVSITQSIFQKAEFTPTGRSFPCGSNMKTLPNIAVVMDGVEYVLTPEDYVRRGGSSPETDCVLGISQHDGKILLGQVFMKKYYTRFNLKDVSLQFAKAKQSK